MLGRLKFKGIGIGATGATLILALELSVWAVATRAYGIEGEELVGRSLAISTNVLAALTGSASGGLTIALDALAGTWTACPTTAPS